jgi:hypothetical protein
MKLYTVCFPSFNIIALFNLLEVLGGPKLKVVGIAVFFKLKIFFFLPFESRFSSFVIKQPSLKCSWQILL